MDHVLKEAAHLRRLHNLAGQVRQAAINGDDDFFGWKVARLLRDAATAEQANEAERQMGIWASIPRPA